MEQPEAPLVDFSALPRRLQSVAGVVGALALLGCVIDGVLHGLTFALMGRWAGLFLLGLLLGTAVLTALHAMGGAGRAGARGQRLSAPDVGLAPRRLQRVDGSNPDGSAEDATGHPDGDQGRAEDR